MIYLMFILFREEIPEMNCGAFHKQAKKEVLPALKAPKRPPIEKEAPIHEISSSSNPRPPKV